ncbi:MAG: hypothetical protein U0892_12955 [Pirellulales bacterium]
MNGLSVVTKSARLREDAYASEIDQILLNNLREAIALQREIEEATAPREYDETREPQREQELQAVGR